jgi:predicted outer membrane repeat protein
MNTSFINNTGASTGGAIFMYNSTYSLSQFILFIGNSAAGGAAILAEANSLMINLSYFTF